MEDMYVMGDNGRELSAKAKGEGILKYFNRCGLYPYTSEITNNERIKLKGVIDKNVNIKGNKKAFYDLTNKTFVEKTSHVLYYHPVVLKKKCLQVLPLIY